jgi:hypothetical protein
LECGLNRGALCRQGAKQSRRRCDDQTAPLQCAACQLGHIAGILANDNRKKQMGWRL